MSSSQPAVFFPLAPNQHQPPASSQSGVLFSYNKSAPATSHQPQPAEQSSGAPM